MPRSKQDPLIAALIAKLPKQGEWPASERKAWLHLMEMAFNTVYGPTGEDNNFVRVGPFMGVRSSVAAPPKPPAHRFIIDEQGYAKSGSGKRVMPSDVGLTPIFDMRGQDGDMRTIIWADESKGLNGADLVITA